MGESVSKYIQSNHPGDKNIDPRIPSMADTPKSRKRGKKLLKAKNIITKGYHLSKLAKHEVGRTKDSQSVWRYGGPKGNTMISGTLGPKLKKKKNSDY